MKPGPQPLTPLRADVERILALEAKRARIKIEALLAPGRPRLKVLAAKRSAIRRIVSETGCSARQLARVWGLAEDTVRDAIRPEPRSVYDPNTRQRLAWAHDAERVRRIIAGQDEATNADLAAWKRLCDRPAT